MTDCVWVRVLVAVFDPVCDPVCDRVCPAETLGLCVPVLLAVWEAVTVADPVVVCDPEPVCVCVIVPVPVPEPDPVLT